jgi:putative transposase
LVKAVRRHGVPVTITIDRRGTNASTIHRYNDKHGTTIVIRRVKYLNNIVAQDHRGVNRVTRPILWFKAFEAAYRLLTGIELMHMLRKLPLVSRVDQGLTAAEQIYSLAA